MAQVAVVIVCWNSWDVLGRCLQCLANQTFRDFTVTVLDNASTLPMPADVLAAFPGLTLVRSEQNLGFAAGNNLAVAQHTGASPWVALLNPDAYAEPGWLAQLMAATVAHPATTFFASRQLMASNPQLLDGEGDVYHLSGKVWRAGHGQPAWHDLPGFEPVFGPCAAAALYRRDVFTAAGGFDEDFFCFLEDVDLSFRLQLQGYGCHLVRSAVVLHQGASSTGNAHSDFAVYHGHRNLVWAYVKNMPGFWFWLLLPLHLLLNALTLLRYAHRPGVIWRAKRDAVLGLGRVWRQRRALQAGRKVNSAVVVRRLSRRLFPF